MKQLLSVVVFSLFVSDAFADDWRMRKFDMNGDGFITVEEFEALGCKVRKSLFSYADKNSDGKLNAKETRKASSVLKLNKCGGV